MASRQAPDQQIHGRWGEHQQNQGQETGCPGAKPPGHQQTQGHIHAQLDQQPPPRKQSAACVWPEAHLGVGHVAP
jgi:hypothetical protein